VKKIFIDTLTVNGKHSIKRWLTLSSFVVATIYAFIPIIFKEFQVQEFIFAGFLAIGGFSIFRTQKLNENLTASQTINAGEQL